MMIDSTSCADCIKQPKQSESSTATPTSGGSQQPPKRANFHHQSSSSSSSSSTSSRLSYFRPQPATTITIATPHYHQHRLLLTPQSPLFTGFNGHPLHHHQHHHSAASALAAAAAVASTTAASHGAAATNGSFQSLSSLSPDARACFTATYLCVLIVNNTWLDCNLLEMLCNGTNTNNSINSKSPGSSTGASGSDPGEDEDNLQSRRNRQQMEAFEMILNELVAFAGGGRDEGGGGNGQSARIHLDQGHNMGRSLPRDGIYVAPIHLKPGGEPELPRQVVPPDEGGGSSSGNTSFVTLFYNNDNQSAGLAGGQNNHHQDELKQSRQPNEQQQSSSSLQYPRVIVAKLNQLSDDDDQAAILRQYFDIRRSQLAARTLSETIRNNHSSLDDVQESGSEKAGTSSLDENGGGGLMATTTTQAPNQPGLIMSWIGRPLRDWSSYLFWSSAAGGDLMNQSSISTNSNIKISVDEPDAQLSLDNSIRSKQDTNKQQQQQQNAMSVQLLRPIDRTENYNTIPTNQTSQKQQLILEFPYNSPATITTNNNHRAQTFLQNRHHNNNQQTTNERLNVGSMQLVGSATTRGSLASPFPPDLADQMSIPLTTLSDLLGSSSSVNMAEVGRQQSSTSTPMQQQQQHSLLRQQQQVSRPPEASFSANSMSIRPVYDTHPPSSQPPIQIFRDSPLSQQQFKNIQQHQNVMFSRQQSGQNQYPRLGDECDCVGEFLTSADQSPAPSSPSSLFSAYSDNDCHRYCQSSRHGQSAPISSSTPSLLDQQTSPVTSFSTTSSTSLTTSGGPIIPSGGKMNPHDVTFLLYTRRHRDLVIGADEDLLQLQSSGSTSQTSSTRNPLTSSSSSPSSLVIAHNNVGSGGGSSASATSGAGVSANANGGGGGGGNQQYSSDEADKNLNPNNSNFNIGLGEILDLNNEDSLSESSFNGSLPVKLIIHGFGSGGRRLWVTDMVYKLLDYEDVNVIVVDWEKGATLPNYVQAAGNTRLVGHKIASLIRAVNARYGLTAGSYHLIGFSLGAHVAGFAGMEIRNSTSISHHWINRITGLDPASPLFEGYEADDRLDPSDAQFVDVIHSNGDGVLRGGFGSLQPMGHVDFYPNGGRVQVGCNSVLLSALSDIIYGKWQSLCNHRRALNFFMDSFEFDKCKFRSFNCDSYESYLKGDCFDCGLNDEKCSYMGYLANYSKGRGKMYLTTHEEAPFCANQFLVKIIGSKGFKTHWGKVEVTLMGQDGRNESFWLSATSQQSNNHELPSGQKDLIQHSMQSLIVSHLALANFTHILLRYTKYRGWIYSGGESWSIDKVYIADSDGRVKSFCGYSTALDSHITTRLNLDSGNCTINEASMVTPAGMNNQQISRASSPTTAGSNTLITSSLQQIQTHHQQQQQQQSQQQQQQQQPQSNQPRTPRLFSPLIQSLGEPQTPPIMVNGHAFQLRSLPANDWHQQLSQLGFGKLQNPTTPLIVV